MLLSTQPGRRGDERRPRRLRAAALRAALIRTALPLALVMGLAACGGHNSPETVPNVDPDTPIALIVQNSHWLDVVVYVVHDGESTRVGDVTAASTGNFVLPRWMIGQGRAIRLVADPVGSGAGTVTDVLTVLPGESVEWHLESQLSRSSVSVY
ncbi:MAG TPA: hypothetical protein VFW66_12780 [Gemmatimonadales bacterium]|nr:hypothetical protein [Gemmatimonadales bacterium]